MTSPDNAELLKQLAAAKVLFQQRTIELLLTEKPKNQAIAAREKMHE